MNTEEINTEGITRLIRLIEGVNRDIATAERRKNSAGIRAYTKLKKEYVDDLVRVLRQRNIPVLVES